MSKGLEVDILRFLYEQYPGGFCFKDLSEGSDADMEWLVSCPDPVVLKLKTPDLGKLVELLISEGMPPSRRCSLLSVTDGSAFGSGTLGDIVLRSKSVRDTRSYLLLADPDVSVADPDPRQSLQGKTVLVTRAKKQASRLTVALEKEGAVVFEIPTIEIDILEESIPEMKSAFESINSYTWLLLTSANTVSIVNGFFSEWKLSWQGWENTRIACIGKATERMVRQAGGEVDLVPPLFQAESLADALLEQGIRGTKILLPRARGSREILPQILRENGAEVDEIFVYEARVPESGRKELKDLLEKQTLDFITFTSSSTVRNFVEMAGDILPELSGKGTRLACIGPITAGTLQEFGVRPDIVAQEFSIPGLVRSILASVS